MPEAACLQIVASAATASKERGRQEPSQGDLQNQLPPANLPKLSANMHIRCRLFEPMGTKRSPTSSEEQL